MVLAGEAESCSPLPSKGGDLDRNLARPFDPVLRADRPARPSRQRRRLGTSSAPEDPLTRIGPSAKLPSLQPGVWQRVARLPVGSRGSARVPSGAWRSGEGLSHLSPMSLSHTCCIAVGSTQTRPITHGWGRSCQGLLWSCGSGDARHVARAGLAPDGVAEEGPVGADVSIYGLEAGRHVATRSRESISQRIQSRRPRSRLTSASPASPVHEARASSNARSLSAIASALTSPGRPSPWI